MAIKSNWICSWTNLNECNFYELYITLVENWSEGIFIQIEHILVKLGLGKYICEGWYMGSMNYSVGEWFGSNIGMQALKFIYLYCVFFSLTLFDAVIWL